MRTLSYRSAIFNGRRKQYHKGGNSCGSILAEAAVATLLFIPMVAYTVNAAIGLMAYSAVDAGCRDAARAAAEAPPDTNNPNNPSDLAQKAANAAVQMHNFGFITLTAQVISYNYTVLDEGAGNNPPNNNFFLCNSKTGVLIGPPYMGPYVTVKTSLVYPLPFPVLTTGCKIGPVPLTFQQIYSYPILQPVIWQSGG